MWNSRLIAYVVTADGEPAYVTSSEMLNFVMERRNAGHFNVREIRELREMMPNLQTELA